MNNILVHWTRRVFEARFQIAAASGYIISGLLGFFASLWLNQIYRFGDQVPYTNFYNAIAELSLLESYRAQYFHLTSNEPAFTLVMWIGANIGVPKIIWVSLFNAILIILILRILKKYNANKFVIILLFTNFYFLVTLTGAERLKFAYILMIAAALSKTYWRWIFAFLAPAFHAQSLIYFCSYLSSRIFERTPYFSFNNRFDVKIAIYVLAFSVFSFVLISFIFYTSVETILYKIHYYFENNIFRPFSILNFFLLFSLGILISRRKMRLIGFFVPVAFVMAIVGPDRVNMIAYTVFFYAILTDNRINHPLALLPMIYLSFKSIGFMNNVITYGEGFPII